MRTVVPSVLILALVSCGDQEGESAAGPGVGGAAGGAAGSDASASAETGADAAWPDAGGFDGAAGAGAEAGSDAGQDSPTDVQPEASVPPGLPHIDDFSGAPSARVYALVQRAIEGLGFPAGSVEGPQTADRVFVGRFYMAWIDQTGFHGKMNGLWRLNGEAGDNLDFSVTDADGRPVSLLVVAENGEGRWPAGYPGAEHAEFPNRVPEPNDNPSCAQGDWCNQYGVNEAAYFTDPDIPWWSSCNAGSMAWTEAVSPVEAQDLGGGIRLVYEARLTKQADGDGTWDSDACHEDYLFSDGVRRPVYVRLGFELWGGEVYFDRTMQFRNPAGNPPFDGPMSMIGGFVVTSWPNPHYLKRLNRYIRPEQGDVNDGVHGVTLVGGQWNAHLFPSHSADEVFAWLGQPVSLSVVPMFAEGRSVTLSHVGPSDNDDVGFCLCSVHGGLELGGGLLHGGISLPVDGGSESIEARRRLALPSEGIGGVVSQRVYEAETDLQHKMGQAEGDGWSVTSGQGGADHLLYGPYATDWGEHAAQAVYWLATDSPLPAADVVVTLEVNDATVDEVVATRTVRRSDFRGTGVYERFGLNVDLGGRGGHAMETRVQWPGDAYVRVDRVVVNVVDDG